MLLSLRTQHENLGDLLINKAAVDDLSSRFNFTANTRKVPDWYRRIILDGKESVEESSSFWAAFSVMRPGAVLLLKPGGYIGIYEGSMALRRLAHGLYLFMIRMMGGRIIRLSSSQGLTSKYNFIERFRLRQIEACLIRDKASIEEVIRLGGKVVPCPDLSVYFFDMDSIFSSKISEIDFSKKTKVVFSFRYDRASYCKVNRVSEFLSELNEDLDVAIVSQVNFDDDYNHSISLDYGVSPIKYDNNIDSICAIKNEYIKSKYVVSDRLHVLLMGVLNGAIPVAFISKVRDAKVVGCLQSLGINNFIFYDDDNFRLNFHELNFDFEEIYRAVFSAKIALSLAIDKVFD